MFTGIVEEVGRIAAFSRRHPISALTIDAPLVCGDVKVGDSIAVDGVCLTVVTHSDASFSVEVQEESIRRTAMEEYRVGSSVNLERALQPHSRMGGHYVQGHVDDVGVVRSWRQEGADWVLRVQVPTTLMRYIVTKGFICINGMSLTVVEISPHVSVHIVPHTRAATTLQFMRVGQRVNIEVDVIAKYCEALQR